MGVANERSIWYPLVNTTTSTLVDALSYEGAITKFDASGKAIEIDGVKAQPYRISVDPSKADQLKQFDPAALPGSITFVLYVGPDDLLRRWVTLSPTGTTKGQLDYTNWGEKVVIAAPSKARITTDSLLDRLGHPDGASPTP